MQSWDQLRADLLAVGFVALLYVELECHKHGALRIGFLADSEFHPACPKCGAMCDAAILARGLSRQPTDWTCASPALPDRHKGHREDPIIVLRCKQNTRRRRPEFLERARRELQEVLPTLTTRSKQNTRRQRPEVLELPKLVTRVRAPEVPSPPRPRNHRATPEEMRRRIVLLAELLLRREPPEVISKTLGIEWQHLRVTICRRKEAIQSVMRSLQGTDLTLSSEVRADQFQPPPKTSLPASLG